MEEQSKGGLFGKSGQGHIKSSNELHKSMDSLIKNKEKAHSVWETLRKETGNYSGLSQKEAMEGLKKMKAGGKLSQRDIDQLKKHF